MSVKISKLKVKIGKKEVPSEKFSRILPKTSDTNLITKVDMSAAAIVDAELDNNSPQCVLCSKVISRIVQYKGLL